jgi:hypothetical protein
VWERRAPLEAEPSEVPDEAHQHAKPPPEPAPPVVAEKAELKPAAPYVPPTEPPEDDQ